MKAACMDVVLFGEFSLKYNGNVLVEKDYRSVKMWAVLAYLILHRQRPVTQEELIQKFWDDETGQNPFNALKTLIFRLRKLLLPLLGEDVQPLVSTVGAYQWNPELHCRVDVDEFEELLSRCEHKGVSIVERKECYEKALALYHGDFLPKAVNLTWHTLRRSYYHMQYCEAICEYAKLMESLGEYEEMMRICNNALRQNVLEEKIFVLLIRGMLHQGNHKQALMQYERTIDILVHEFGTTGSSELKNLYKDIMNETRNEEHDMAAVLEDMQDSRKPGAFFCEYGFFKEAYRLEARRIAQIGLHSCVALITLVPTGGKILSKEMQSHIMKALEKAMSVNLRIGDVVAKYSRTQYVVIFPGKDYDESLEACRRVEDYFHKNRYHRIADVNHEVHVIDSAGN